MDPGRCDGDLKSMHFKLIIVNSNLGVQSQFNISEHFLRAVNIGPGNGLVPLGTKPLAGPMLTAIYRQVSNIRRIKSQNWNVSSLVLQLSLPNPLEPGVRSIMKMLLEQRRQAMLQLHLNDQ